MRSFQFSNIYSEFNRPDVAPKNSLFPPQWQSLPSELLNSFHLQMCLNNRHHSLTRFLQALASHSADAEIFTFKSFQFCKFKLRWSDNSTSMSFCLTMRESFRLKLVSVTKLYRWICVRAMCVEAASESVKLKCSWNIFQRFQALSKRRNWIIFLQRKQRWVESQKCNNVIRRQRSLCLDKSPSCLLPSVPRTNSPSCRPRFLAPKLRFSS